MQGYEPGDCKALNKNVNGANDPTASVSVQLHPNLKCDDEEDNMDDLADYEELEYFAGVSATLVKNHKGAVVEG